MLIQTNNLFFFCHCWTGLSELCFSKVGRNKTDLIIIINISNYIFLKDVKGKIMHVNKVLKHVFDCMACIDFLEI